MTTIRLKIDVKSSFATFPKADMIFGHFAYHLFSNNDLRLENYLQEDPKIIFSDFIPLNYLPKPTLPLDSFGVSDTDKKDFRKKEWIKIEDLQNGDMSKCVNIEFYKTNVSVKNSLSRLTFSTQKEIFTPYSLEEIEFLYEPSLYVSFDKDFKKEEIVEILNKIGKNGFGKKSSTGKGSFSVSLDESFKGFEQLNTYYYMTISPTIPKENDIEEFFYNTFNRFGKYSNSGTPFKKPVLMADSAAVVKLKNSCTYIGRAINNGTNKTSFLQAYSILVPFKFNEKGLIC